MHFLADFIWLNTEVLWPEGDLFGDRGAENLRFGVLQDNTNGIMSAAAAGISIASHYGAIGSSAV